MDKGENSFINKNNIFSNPLQLLHRKKKVYDTHEKEKDEEGEEEDEKKKKINNKNYGGGESNDHKMDNALITAKSVILFQLIIFFIYFFVLLVGSFNFSFKLSQAKEKHLYEYMNIIKHMSTTCEFKLYYKQSNIYNNYNNNDSNDNKEVVYKNTNNLINNNDSFMPNLNFKYYFTKGKDYEKSRQKTKKKKKKKNDSKECDNNSTCFNSDSDNNNNNIKIFICLNKQTDLFNYDINIYNILQTCKKYVIRMIHFAYNEIKNAFFSKKGNDSNSTLLDNNDLIKASSLYHHNEEIFKYIYYNTLLNKNNTYNKYYVLEQLFYHYLDNICYYHDFKNYKNVINETDVKTGEKKKTDILDDNKNYTLKLNQEISYINEKKLLKETKKLNKEDVAFLINHMHKYLNDKQLFNILHTLYFHICKKDIVLKNYEKNVIRLKKTEPVLINSVDNNKQRMDKNNEDNIKNSFLVNGMIISYDKYYDLYHMYENVQNVSLYSIFINKLRRKIKTIETLKRLNNCIKNYIINLKNIPIYFFLDDFLDTPCYIYNTVISNILRYYYNGIFLYLIIFIGCIHVFFSPFPITLVHFRRFFIYFVIIMYRVFIWYFIPSIIQYIIYKCHYFKEEKEYKHIFDYSDHVILFATLLFIITLEAKAIKHTIKHQSSSSENFHYKYNKKVCSFFLTIILYYYYMLISLFLYTSYYTAKYFHTTNEIFVAYFFSTFSIFFLFYYFLYRNYFSFYSIGITSQMNNKTNISSNSMNPTSYMYNFYNSLK
ncbi:conserved membrane protein, unknown function [Hepatocystis sp. ex Piliocolobus tephrosceles]|nr:conserved membrane protein, unknown function [Hepatocystis sp. ex Piliocolobus tephrosceles]